MFIECTCNEVFLVCPEPKLVAVDRLLDSDRFNRRFTALTPIFQVHDCALGDAFNIRYYEFGERHSILVVPEEIKFLLHPSDRYRVGVFPDHFIVCGKGALGFVNAADKGSLCAVDISNDARFAVH